MRKEYGLGALLLWLAGTVTAFVAMSWEVVTAPITLQLADGTAIHGVLYRPASSSGALPAVVVAHGTALALQSCAPGFAVPLAHNGYLVLAIDTRGHGRSGGSVPANDFHDPLATFDTLAEHPEIDAAIDFLKRQPDADPAKIALLGHSRGGWACANVGYQRADVRCVVCIGAAPGVCDGSRPRNLFILTGSMERLCPLDKCRAVLRRATNGTVEEPNIPFGSFAQGTARHLFVVQRANHLTETTNPTVTRYAVQWVNASLGNTPPPVPGEWLTVVTLAVVMTLVGGLPAAAWILGLVAGRWLQSPVAAPRPWKAVRLGSFFVLLMLLVPLAAAGAHLLEAGPVYFALPALFLFGSLGVLGLGADVLGRRAGEDRRVFPDSKTLVRGTALGLVALGLAFIWLGLPWGITWAQLVPTPRRGLLAAVFLPLLLPWALALALGLEGLIGVGGRTPARQNILAGGLVWLAVPALLWAGHLLLATAYWPLFGVPAGIVVAGFFVPWPLWLVPARPGMTFARAVSHAAGTAWLLACHLPFVHGT